MDIFNFDRIFLQEEEFYRQDKYYENQIWQFISTENNCQYKIYHPSNIIHKPAYLDISSNDTVFLQSWDIPSTEPFYHNQIWQLHKADGSYKLFNLVISGHEQRFFDASSFDFIFCQPYNLEIGNEYYKNQVWKLIQKSEIQTWNIQTGILAKAAKYVYGHCDFESEGQKFELFDKQEEDGFV